MNCPALCKTVGHQVCINLANDNRSLLSEVQNAVNIRKEYEKLQLEIHRVEKPEVYVEFDEGEIEEKEEFEENKRKRTRDDAILPPKKKKARAPTNWNDLFEAATAIQLCEDEIHKKYMQGLITSVVTGRPVVEIKAIVEKKESDPYAPMTMESLIHIPMVHLYVTGRKAAQTYIESTLMTWPHRYKESTIGIQFLVRTNPWFEDMLLAYDSTQTKTSKGPMSAMLNNYLFVEHHQRFKLGTDDSITSRVVRSFPLDIAYVFSRFGGMLSCLPFIPIDSTRRHMQLNYEMANTVYPDSQLFFHFAAHLESTKVKPAIDYYDFMANEKDYFDTTNEKHAALIKAVKKACTFIQSTLTDKMFFPKKMMSGLVKKDHWESVPNSIVELLAPFIIDNQSDEIERITNMSANQKMDYLYKQNITRDNPLGRYFNYSYAANVAIKAFIKELSERNRISDKKVYLRGNRIELGRLEPVRDVYRMLALAATVVRLLDMPALFLAKTTILTNYKKPFYIPSLEAFPGVIPLGYIAGEGSYDVVNKSLETMSTREGNIFLKDSFYVPENEFKKARRALLDSFQNFIKSLPPLTQKSNYKYMPGMLPAKPHDPKNHKSVADAFAPYILDVSKDPMKGMRKIETSTLLNLRSSMRTEANYIAAGLIDTFRYKKIDLGAVNDIGLRYLISTLKDDEALMDQNLYNAYGKDRRYFMLWPIFFVIHHEEITFETNKENADERDPSCSLAAGRDGNRSVSQADEPNSQFLSFLSHMNE